MTWRLKIRHHTGFRYRSQVTSSYNEARITPLTTDRQLVIEAFVRVEPQTRTFRYWDYWTTIVDAFDVHTPHTELTVTGTSVVETSPPLPAPPRIGWQELASSSVCDHFAELLAPTAYAPVAEESADVARRLAAAHEPAEACQAAAEWVRQRLRYVEGSTDVSTPAVDALRNGEGVCQDFAHLALSVLRTMGIPARYVSGYLYPAAEAAPGQTVAGQSHAWVEAWTGDWHAVDPTSGNPVGERHVMVARGRDYADVSPLKGIYLGGPAETMAVTVELTRLA